MNFDNSSAVFVTSNADYNRYASNTVVTFLYNSFEIDINYADFDISCGKRYIIQKTSLLIKQGLLNLYPETMIPEG